jgi:hypothetical protein
MRRTIEVSVVSLLLAACASGRDAGEGFRGETEGHESSGSTGDVGDDGDDACPDLGCGCEHDCEDDCEKDCGDDCDKDCEDDCKDACQDACDDDEGCVRTQGYWKNHSGQSEGDENQSLWPLDEGVVLCGTSWIDWLWTEPEGDAWIILVRQWIAARLNVAAGAGASDEVTAALDEAEGMLAACVIGDEERELAIDLATTLDQYNNGNMGVAKCP